ncbi:MAG: hypothetical protein EAZ08_06975 [Cytophagales bacterium]|nr:MAG: hypothetical protein EAZ08_06975 [Cytophagales bacterium]
MKKIKNYLVALSLVCSVYTFFSCNGTKNDVEEVQQPVYSTALEQKMGFKDIRLGSSIRNYNGFREVMFPSFSEIGTKRYVYYQQDEKYLSIGNSYRLRTNDKFNNSNNYFAFLFVETFNDKIYKIEATIDDDYDHSFINVLLESLGQPFSKKAYSNIDFIYSWESNSVSLEVKTKSEQQAVTPVQFLHFTEMIYIHKPTFALVENAYKQYQQKEKQNINKSF